MKMRALSDSFAINENYWNDWTESLFDPTLVETLTQLHNQLQSERRNLLKARIERQKEFDSGKLPTYLDKTSEAVTGNWKVSPLPTDLKKRRVEITGPVNDPKMVINMLSRNSEGERADTAMLDFEDSMCPTFENVLDGYKNVTAVSEESLTYTKPDGSKTYQLDPKDMALMMIRVRGLHMDEANITIAGEPISGGLLDLTTSLYKIGKNLISQGRTPKFYVPKCEHHLEARWWSRLFHAVEGALGLPTPTLRATFLIETLPAAFQIEEILYEIRTHAAGLNVGRWDKIFSDIKVLKNHPDRIAPDRSTINMSKYWMDNYAKRLIKICHTRGAFAIGGMSAFTPGKEASVREQQTQKVFEDKSNEFAIGHDGCWVSHPYFITYALKAFPKDNQIDVLLEGFDKYPELIMDGKGPKTINGLRTNCRVGIAYMQGWNKGIGCVAFDDLMEDLATLEISRAQTWQWLHHKVNLDDGTPVTKEMVEQVFNEEYENIVNELKDSGVTDENVINEFAQAKTDAQRIFLDDELKDFLTVQ